MCQFSYGTRQTCQTSLDIIGPWQFDENVQELYKRQVIEFPIFIVASRHMDLLIVLMHLNGTDTGFALVSNVPPPALVRVCLFPLKWTPFLPNPLTLNPSLRL